VLFLERVRGAIGWPEAVSDLVSSVESIDDNLLLVFHNKRLANRRKAYRGRSLPITFAWIIASILRDLPHDSRVREGFPHLEDKRRLKMELLRVSPCEGMRSAQG
jgi:hypothetical protein